MVVVGAVDAVVVGVAEEEVALRHPPLVPSLKLRGTEGPSIRTSLRVNGRDAACTTGGAVKLIFALSQPLVHGRTFSHPSHLELVEKLTNSTSIIVTLTSLKNC